MTYNFSMHGIDVQFEDNSKEILAALLNAATRGLDSVGETAVGYAVKNLVQNNSVDTGRLMGDINYQVDGEDVYIGTALEYAVYVEMGTGKYAPGGRPTPWVYQDAKGNWHWTQGNPAKPFLVPAAKNHTQEYRQLLVESLENA